MMMTVVVVVVEEWWKLVCKWCGGVCKWKRCRTGNSVGTCVGLDLD